MTDAPAKSIQRKQNVIDKAISESISVNFLISPSNCHITEADTQHYRDIATASCGIVVDTIEDFNELATFAEALDGALERCPAKRKRLASSCIDFYASAFTSNIKILFFYANKPIHISIPGGKKKIIDLSGSLASFVKSAPTPGKYSACSDSSFTHQTVIKSNLDFYVEFHEDERLTIGKN